MIVVVDYGMGNLGSILNMIKKVGGQGSLSTCRQDIERADKIILPGVGSFDRGMANLHRLDYVGPMTDKVLAGTPVLGICLGMQLFSDYGEEGDAPGLGWVKGRTIRFAFDEAHRHLKIPHMRWNTVTVRQPCSLFPPTDVERRFYFVHSYHVRCEDPASVLTTTQYGIEFASAIIRGNAIGTQFHPEKSHRHGIDLMRRFVHEFPAGAGRADGAAVAAEKQA